jgi:hypothetical protein
VLACSGGGSAFTASSSIVFVPSRSKHKQERKKLRASLGRLSSFHRCNQSPLTIFDPDLITLQHFGEGLEHIGTLGPVLNCSKVNFGEVPVGPLSKLFTDVIQNILHIH